MSPRLKQVIIELLDLEVEPTQAKALGESLPNNLTTLINKLPLQGKRI